MTGGQRSNLLTLYHAHLTSALRRMRTIPHACCAGSQISDPLTHRRTQLTAALERVRAGADVMPRRQLEKVLVDELGSEWRTKVALFEDEPLAAASIGQVRCRQGLPRRLLTLRWHPDLVRERRSAALPT